ncbi:MAG: hypothetical protein KKA05_10295 [Alphaproteobacteria bacterium]|nr:hypothetical protein [Alphaproteobacteria bacterium]
MVTALRIRRANAFAPRGERFRNLPPTIPTAERSLFLECGDLVARLFHVNGWRLSVGGAFHCLPDSTRRGAVIRAARILANAPADIDQTGHKGTKARRAMKEFIAAEC